MLHARRAAHARALPAVVTAILLLAGGRAWSQTWKTLMDFTGPNGIQPFAGLIRGTDGDLYGTTVYGGAADRGTVLALSPAGGQTILHTFTGADGAYPIGELVQTGAGVFYGTTSGGGAHGAGTVFSITPAGAFAVLYSFTTSGSAGFAPYAGLTLGTDGALYGVTTFGGSGWGAAYRITTAGAVTGLHAFTFIDGAYVIGGLTRAADGSFFGAASGGGAYSQGTAFRVTSTGTFTLLHSFRGFSFTGVSDGANPYGKLALATDGNFYGTSLNGGANDRGEVYRLTPAGAVTPVYSFTPLHLNNQYIGINADGAAPYAGLAQGSTGALYGTAAYGGANGWGTVFKVTTSGAFTTLHSFTATRYGVNSDGAVPTATPVFGATGTLYGSAKLGGSHAYGTLFQISGG